MDDGTLRVKVESTKSATTNGRASQTPEPLVDKKDKEPAKKARSEARPYPPRTLEDCIKVVEAIKTQNAGNPWPPDEIAKAIKIKSRSSNLRDIIRSAGLYGIIEGTYRATAISLSILGRKLAYPGNDEELKAARQEAVLSVEIFKKVIEHYRGGAIPESPYINNTLTRDFGLQTEFHNEFLSILRKNVEYAFDSITALSSRDLPPSTISATGTLKKSSIKSSLRAFVIMPFSEKSPALRPEGFFKEVY